MREILFRGIRQSTGEFIYGSYVHGWNKLGGEKTYGPTIITKDKALLVIPESVGQYTGLKDKNGKMIFEGDIVMRDDSRDPHEIVFHHGTFKEKDSDTLFSTSWEIIGNIHQHNHLLK